MNTLGKIAVATVATFGLLTATASADVAKGQKLYAKKLKKMCDMSGAKFAATHTQMEWESAKDEGTLTELFTGACPAGEKFFKGDKFQKKYQEHIYDFVYEYASDSGNVPSC